MAIESHDPATRKLHKFFSFHSNSVFYRLTMAFTLFFMGPLLGLLFLSVKTDLFGTNELLYCLAGLLISTLFGYLIMRQISDGIARVENQMAEKIRSYINVENVGEDELGNIENFADEMSKSMQKTGESLSRRMEEIHALRELGSLSALQTTAQSLATTTLQRSIEVTEATGGAILLVVNNRLVCRYIIGECIAIGTDTVIQADSFAGYGAIKTGASTLLHRQDCGDWDSFFSKACGCAAVIPFGNVNGAKLVAVLASDSEKGWDDTTLEFLSTYFNGAGSALKMQEIGIRKKETTEELKTVLSIIKILNSNLQEENLLSVITRKLQEILPHHWVGLVLLDEMQGNPYLSQSIGKDIPGIETGIPIENENSLFQLAIKSGEPVAVDNLAFDKNYYENRLFEQLKLKSCIIESLNNSGKPIGAICLGSEKAADFSKRDKRVFAMVAMGVAIALEQTRLLSRERSKRAELEELNKIGAALSTHTIKAGRALHYILERIASLVDVEAGSIMILEFDTLVIQAATGPYNDELLKQKVGLGHGVAGYVVSTGEPVIVQDAKESQHFFSDIDEKTGFETRNLLCVPMISSGRIIGVIELLNKKGPVFSKDDLQTVKAVAASTAIALENSRLYSETEYIAKKERFIRTIFQKYVPEEIVTDILEKGESDQLTVGEKKIVTVFNVDIRGYSKMSRQASTEDVVQVLNYFFERMGNIVVKHKGVLDKYLGDGLLAIFGAPVATINPALDAVLAAQEMVEAIEELSILSLDRCGVPIKIGISINTGEAIVGNIGFDKKMEYTVIGDVVNETFRLQDLTKNKTNSILIGDATYQEVKSAVNTTSFGLQRMDGSTLDVYEVINGAGDQSELQEYIAPENLAKDASGKVH